MPQELIIGRSPSSPVKIPADRSGVSGQHVKITVSDNGIWKLEDLKSANGTYVRDENGDFQRVYTKQIKESDIIRLGNDGANSFSFYAHRAITSEDSYLYEFKQLRKALNLQKALEEKIAKKSEIAGWIQALVPGIILGATLCIPQMDMGTRCILMAVATPMFKIIFNGNSKAMRNIKKRREKLLLCPKCFKPISEFDIEQGQCSRCKAK